MRPQILLHSQTIPFTLTMFVDEFHHTPWSLQDNGKPLRVRESPPLRDILLNPRRRLVVMILIQSDVPEVFHAPSPLIRSRLLRCTTLVVYTRLRPLLIQVQVPITMFLRRISILPPRLFAWIQLLGTTPSARNPHFLIRLHRVCALFPGYPLLFLCCCCFLINE